MYLISLHLGHSTLGQGSGSGHSILGQGLGGGQAGQGGHFLQRPALTFTLGLIQGGHFWAGGKVLFLTYSL